MGYEKFYRLCTDYNFMLKDAVHFGVYSENDLKNIQNELGELLKLMADDPVYAQYKPLLQEIYQDINNRNDISRFFPSARKLQGKVKARKFAGDIPLYMLCASALAIAGALPGILRL